MKHANVAIFVPHNGCPHQCSFCNQRSITGKLSQPTPQDVLDAVEIARASLGKDTKNAEIAFFGGSFTAIERGYMVSLLNAAAPFVKDGTFAGIRISTRPDYIDDEILALLKRYGVTAIELGAQSMAVPAHDTRDWEFAKKFDLPIVEVVQGGDVQKEAFTDCETGIMVNSGILDGLTVEEAKKKITEFLTEKGIGHSKVNFKLRDWVFSRQRYWGEPIPIVYCEKCGYVPLTESELPLRLPNVKSYEPTDTGESPLAHMTDWVETTCPHCGGKARRETDTMYPANSRLAGAANIARVGNVGSAISWTFTTL